MVTSDPAVERYNINAFEPRQPQTRQSAFADSLNAPASDALFWRLLPHTPKYLEELIPKVMVYGRPDLNTRLYRLTISQRILW
jgi:hypothetical protein